MSLFSRTLFTLICLYILSGPAYAASLNVACAANFTSPMKKLAALYEKKTGTKVQCTFGSTGMLYGQITKGAPYDLFFAADEKRPTLLFKAGLANTPSLYAKGKAVLWSKNASLKSLSDWKAVITAKAAKKIGIANPKTAPYGLRATEAMATAGLTDKATPKLVFGKNVSMSFQYAYSGAADASFVALSQALSTKGKAGKYWKIPEAGPVHQAACVLKRGATSKATAFLQWLNGSAARKIIGSYGYE